MICRAWNGTVILPGFAGCFSCTWLPSCAEYCHPSLRRARSTSAALSRGSLGKPAPDRKDYGGNPAQEASPPRVAKLASLTSSVRCPRPTIGLAQ